MVSIKIKEIPKIDRPRERLISKGSSSLSDEELLAIILKTGTNNVSAKELAGQIINYAGGLSNLNNLSLPELLKIKGIGEAKACDLLAVLELARRINQKRREILKVKLIHPQIVVDYYKHLTDLDQEHFYCLYLNSQKKVIGEKLLFIGTVNYSMVHPRDVFKEAYLLNAVGIICIHNHPGGDVAPSKDDEVITQNLKKVGELLGIEIVDHIIIGGDNYYSFKENDKI